MKKIGDFNFFVFLVFLISSVSVFSQTRVEVEMNPSDGVVQVGERFEVYINVISNENFTRADIAEPKVPPELTILDTSTSGISVAARLDQMTGKNELTKSQSFRFLVAANQIGKVKFPSIRVTVDDVFMTSGSLNVQITEKSNAPARPKRPNQREPDPFGEDDEMDPFSQLMREQDRMLEEMRKRMGIGGGLGGGGVFDQGRIQEKQLDVNPRDSFFVHLEVSQNEVYEGQQVTVNWFLYTKNPIVSLDRVKFPDLKGFWKEIIQEIPQLNFTPELVNGQVYQKALLASHALFPIKPGQAVIDEFKIKAKTRSNSAYNGGISESTRMSKRTVIKVLPLPTDTRPPSFSGAVGQFQIQTNLDGLTFPVGQPFRLLLRFEGQGNAKLIELPPIQWPEGFEVFDTKSDAKFSVDGTSYKEFEVLLIPKVEGKFEIPKITFSYFDPNLKAYDSKMTEAIPIEITKAEASQQNSARVKKDSAPQNIPDPLPILIWPEPGVMGLIGSIFGFSKVASTWNEMKWPVFASVGSSALIFLVVFGFLDFLKIRRRPTLKEQLKIRFMMIDRTLAAKNERLCTTQSINLIYLLLASMAQEKSANLEWAALVEKIPLNLREKFERVLSEQFEYFQLIGFAPEQARVEVLKSKPLASQVAELKRISTEISESLPKEQT